MTETPRRLVESEKLAAAIGSERGLSEAITKIIAASTGRPLRSAILAGAILLAQRIEVAARDAAQGGTASALSILDVEAELFAALEMGGDQDAGE